MDATVTERELILNDTLEHSDIYQSNENLKSFIEYKFRGQNIVRDVINGQYQHYSFIEYLKMAYDYHKGIIIKPDFIWHTVLYELSQVIMASPDKYRDFFTSQAEGKIEISVPTGDPQLIDLRLIIQELNELVPTDTQNFLLEFSTTDLASEMAINAAFCEAVSPYYDYSMFLCGLPKMKIFGTPEDWDSIKTACNNLCDIFDDHNPYLNSICDLVDKFKEGTDVEYFATIFNSQSEGSGSKLHIDGWVKELFIDKTHTKFNDMPRQVSSVEYKFLNTGQDFKLHCSLFSSNLEDEYLVPEFGYVIEEL
tara:strand:+ start:213706 stop:214632 length:927 start_codon:yes stop_codon:yes gene_type:complete